MNAQKFIRRMLRLQRMEELLINEATLLVHDANQLKNDESNMPIYKFQEKVEVLNKRGKRLTRKKNAYQDRLDKTRAQIDPALKKQMLDWALDHLLFN